MNPDQTKSLIDAAQHIVVIQGENPDGDSLGTSLALEEILGDLGKQVTLYCAINIPHYLGYIKGWDRVIDELPKDFDLSIIVDTASATLLEKALTPQNQARLQAKPSLVLDHHTTEGSLPFTVTSVVDSSCVATSELVYKLATANNWPVNAQAAEHMLASIMSDSLGLSTENTTAASIHTVGSLVELGASISTLENRRREFMKKSPEILHYKGALLQRVEFHLEGTLALVHIPWEDIAEFSDQYNPSMLVIDEMRLVHNVRLAIALKTYPDGKITGKIRCNPDAKIAETVAKFFGGGGHPYVAGFKTYENDYATLKNELLGAVDRALRDYDESCRQELAAKTHS